ncbi:hypothetical protein E2C01_076348 [Portunus trituberculatus]|uniref:Uncharacterized protein n=1 Tax=Portunus trituberculatus TaxID=210409 RepID=A0A5B7IJJ7_PORTR|nr:hypothetical protein [Portunus trituberculatus]
MYFFTHPCNDAPKRTGLNNSSKTCPPPPPTPPPPPPPPARITRLGLLVKVDALSNTCGASQGIITARLLTHTTDDLSSTGFLHVYRYCYCYCSCYCYCYCYYYY